ncbi:MAG: hypothetical protein V1788_02110 [Nanoarchaeota archaeon]
MEELKTTENVDKFGVQDVKVENEHYVVSIIWADGKKNQRVFPKNGFLVVDPETNQKIKHLSGEEALSILKEQSLKCDADDFSWRQFIT